MWLTGGVGIVCMSSSSSSDCLVSGKILSIFTQKLLLFGAFTLTTFSRLAVTVYGPAYGGCNLGERIANLRKGEYTSTFSLI